MSIRLCGGHCRTLFCSFDKNCFVFVAVCFESLSRCNVHFLSKPIFKIDFSKFSFGISMYLSVLTMPSIDKFHTSKNKPMPLPILSHAWQSVKHIAFLKIHLVFSILVPFLFLFNNSNSFKITCFQWFIYTLFDEIQTFLPLYFNDIWFSYSIFRDVIFGLHRTFLNLNFIINLRTLLETLYFWII